MPRTPRVEYGGAVYHVMSRGVKGMPIRLGGTEEDLFTETLGQACERTGWRVHAFVQMQNHYHALIETPEANLVDGMKWFQGAYAQRFNGRYGQRGQVFQGRYKALIVDPDEGRYFETISTYIHLNPVRARQVQDAALQSFLYSSYPAYLRPRRSRPTWLEVERVLGNLGLADDRAGRRAYGSYIQRQVLAWNEEQGRKQLTTEWKEIRRGWYLGGESFRDELLERLGGVLDLHQCESYSGAAVVQHNEQQAERLIAAGMESLGLTGADLLDRPKGDPAKCALAWLAHSRTTVSHSWLTQRLHMGTPNSMTAHIDSIRYPSSALVTRLRRRVEKVTPLMTQESED